MRRLMVLLFLVGCVPEPSRVGGSSSPAMLPPPPAGYTGPYFEHVCVYPQGEHATVLDEASRNGWELVNATDYKYCFKRPRQ